MAQVITDATGAQAHLGYVAEVEGGAVRVVLDVAPHHTNRNGHLHGGLMAVLLDSAMGYTASLHDDADVLRPTVTVSMTVNYLAPGRGGRVVATAQVTGGGRRLKFVDGVLRDADGVTLATASGVFKMLDGHGPGGDA
ncbi:MAG: PaaI family thioesterase [Alphaproteobacteria bacterium]|nr:MAG: PaaI family thioesterase [Alphaproteobacteria bacterium]